MCYPCKHCGHCEKSRPKPLGMCPMCKTMNEPGDSACKECGFKLPPLPGISAKTQEEGEPEGRMLP